MSNTPSAETMAEAKQAAEHIGVYFVGTGFDYDHDSVSLYLATMLEAAKQQAWDRAIEKAAVTVRQAVGMNSVTEDVIRSLKSLPPEGK